MRSVTIRPGYALAAVLFFAVEVLIALYVKDRFVRPYVGDVLAVILVYCGLRAALPVGAWTAILASLGIAIAIELMQLAGALEMLGLQDNRVARIVLGSSFEWLDLVAYGVGAAIVALVEWRRARNRPR